jgi:hypothetical protein
MDEERALYLLRTLQAVGGAAGRIYCHDFSRPVPKGTFVPDEALQNPDFSLGLTGWTVNDGGGRVIFDGYSVSLYKKGATLPYIEQAVTTPSTDRALVVDIGPGPKADLDIKLTTSPNWGGTSYFSKTVSGYGRHVFLVNASSNTYLTIKPGASVQDDEYVNIQEVSLTKCLYGDPSPQSGSTILVQSRSVSQRQNSVLLPGDMVHINGELRQIVAPAHADSFGWVKLQLDYPLRKTMPGAAPVLLNKPFGKFILDTDTISESITPPNFRTISFDLIEDVL